MKHQLIILLALLLNIPAMGQQSGEIIYSMAVKGYIIDTATVNDNLKSSIVKRVKRLRSALVGEPSLFKLQFNIHESFYSGIPRMANDANPTLANIIKRQGQPFYTNINTKTHAQQAHRYGKDYIKTWPQGFLNWTIKPGTKTIAGYKCQKAIATYQSNSLKKIKVTAWFCPALPFQFGPKEFYGLPGLILGLKIFNQYFFAQQVHLKPITVTPHLKGEKMNYLEYDRTYKSPWDQ